MSISALRDTPIKRKLTIITMATSGVSLLIACLAFLTYDLTGLRASMIDDLGTTAAIVGENSTAALSFRDPDSAKQTLNSLTTHPHIVGAIIYDKDGAVFAKYRSNAFPGALETPSVERDSEHMGRDFLRLFRSIKLDGEQVGTIYLQSDLQEVRNRINNYALIFVLVMIAALGAAYLLSRKLQTSISAPISHLAKVAAAVGRDENYSVRAVKHGEDEMGSLIDGFNEMLNQIQQRDSALQEARDALEQRVAERTQELAHSLSTLNATLESSVDGILANRFADDSITYNSRFLEMWGISPDMVQNATAADIIRWSAIHTKNPEQYSARAAQLRADPTQDSFDVIELQDGRVFECTTKALWVDGKVEGVVINFRDITARIHAAQELEAVHKQLLDSSRQAGMAEVATGVLHNVGNVLNSVNVSTNLIAEKTRNSRVASLEKVATLLREHEHDLGEFIGKDQRGKHLPQFLLQLSDHLLAEHEHTLKELESLRNNVEHIKQIVAMQQTYSKVSGVKERVDVIELVEDALRIHEEALRRHGVQVVRDFDAVPRINTDKHKILQILVNLVSNAKYACGESRSSEKRLHLRVAGGGDRIKIVVSDNGMGISPDNLTRIFGHGFTTRKDGHGFGLHSGALAARELGGSLRADSAGLGQGAQFTLELPLETAA